jgi:hypothetical protein
MSNFYKLADISLVRNWDYKKPTLVVKERFTPRQAWTESSTFWDNFVEKNPVFKDISIDGITIAGGAVVDLLMGRNPNDIDLYVQIDPEAENPGALLAARVKSLVGAIYDWMKQRNALVQAMKDEGKKTKLKTYKLNSLKVSRYMNVYTIEANCISVPIQVSSFSTLQEHFDQVDIACTEVAYYQGEVLFSARGKVAFEDMAFVINDTRSSVKYLERVVKYFKKGFDIILPQLDLSKVPRRNLEFGGSEFLDLPFLLIEVDGVNGNKIEVEEMKPNYSNFPSAPNTKCETAYNSVPSCILDAGQIIHQNIQSLIREKYSQFIYYGEGELYMNACLSKLYLTERMIVNSYETVLQKTYHEGKLDISKLENYFTCKSVHEVLDELIVDYVKGCEDGNPIFGSKFSDHIQKTLKSLVEEQIALAKRLLLTIDEHLSLEVEITKETTCKEPKDWYGEYFLSE